MKHHLYQIYYGGIKELLKYHYYCKTCNEITNYNHTKAYRQH